MAAKGHAIIWSYGLACFVASLVIGQYAGHIVQAAMSPAFALGGFVIGAHIVRRRDQ